MDGKFSNKDSGYYHSTTSQTPWLKTEFDQTITLAGIRLYNRQNCCGNRLKNIMVRAGTTKIPDNYSGIITQNTFCGNFTGPGANSGVYVITCQSPIIADVITIQIVQSGDQTLQLDEIEFIKSKGIDINQGHFLLIE